MGPGRAGAGTGCREGWGQVRRVWAGAQGGARERVKEVGQERRGGVWVGGGLG